MAFGSPQNVAISASANGNNTVVAGVGGQKILVLGYTLVVASAVSCQWTDSASSILSGAMPFAANGGISVPFGAFNEGYLVPQFQTAAGASLILNLSSGVLVAGHLTYCLQPSP